MKLKTKTKFQLLAGVAAMSGLMMSCKDGYDLADNTPEWLGSSIYEFLNSDGNFTNTVRLIDDMGYTEVLAKTGSKTLFVADDAAFQRFFQNNTWGVHSYEELTEAQKKLLLFGSMINNACQVAYLSSSEGPIEGDCMRRLTASSEYDSIPLLTPAEMPNTPYWQYYHDHDKTIACANDLTAPPMTHLIESFLTNKLIDNNDCNFLTNYKEDRQPGDAHVNGIKMIRQNVKCSNGFVHQMAEVITPQPNMAQYITQTPELSGFARLLNRFCAPYYAGKAETEEYNRLNPDAKVDSLFVKRYFSERSFGGKPVLQTPDESPVSGTLKFDPGWSQFYSSTTTSTPVNVALQENMGVMLVPDNDALDRYWNNGAGSTLKARYGSWDNVPDKVVSKLLNVNMLNSFVGSVPSKFESVLNDANDELGIKASDISRVQMTCNGAVYVTNKVFNPVAYVSVSFPALINETMSVLYWGIEQLGFDVYLNSQNTYYSFFIPCNESLLNYVDPCSYGKPNRQMLKFRFDPDAANEEEKVKATIWNIDPETNQQDSIGEASYALICDRLEDILDTHIVIGDVESGNTFYKTKGGSMVKINNAAMGEHGMTVQGGFQVENGNALKITKIYNTSDKEDKTGGNGKTYILDDQSVGDDLAEPIMTARRSVYDVLADHSEFDAFRELLESSQYLEKKHVIGTDEHGCPSQNISLFNTFRYTVYVPTNEAVAALQTAGKLPTWEMVEEEEDTEKQDSLRTEIENFIKYHIQDESFFVGEGAKSGEYETSAYNVIDGNLQYYKLKVNASNAGLQVTDALGNKLDVTTDDKLRNIMVREYQYNSADAANATEIYTSSFAVIHQINGALQYK